MQKNNLNWYLKLSYLDYDSGKNPLSSSYGKYDLFDKGNVPDNESDIGNLFSKRKRKKRKKRNINHERWEYSISNRK